MAADCGGGEADGGAGRLLCLLGAGFPGLPRSALSQLRLAPAQIRAQGLGEPLLLRQLPRGEGRGRLAGSVARPELVFLVHKLPSVLGGSKRERRCEQAL
jgi:hypothetical protein